MRAHIPPVIWFGTILAVYGLFHVPVHLYLLHTTGQHFGPLLAAMGVLSIAGLVIARYHRNLLTESIAVAGSLWMGAVFIAFMVFSTLEVVAHAAGIGHHPILGYLAAAALIVVALYLGRWSRVRSIRLTLRGLRRPVSLVQLSDLHIGDIYREGFLERVVQQTNALRPEIVVITGDLFDGAGKLHTGMIDALKLLHAKHVLYVNGNHEIYEGLHVTNAMVDHVGVTRLDDSITEIAGIQFIGLSYPEDMRQNKRETLRALVRRCNKKKPIVLLRHEPKNIAFAASLGVDLQLSGHTHNGQIWPLSYLVLLAYEFRVGLHKIGDFTIYISPGTGSWGPPMRLGSRSEITHFTLRPAHQDSERQEAA